MRTVPLQQICDIQIGKTPSRSVPEYWNGDMPWVAIRDFKAGRTVTTTKEGITPIGAEKSGSKLIPKGTLLLSFKLSLGKRTFAGCDLFTNEAIAALQILDPYVADSDFLYWALGSIDYDRLVDRAAMGKTLNKAKLKILQIPLPPLAEQKRIAGILDAADKLRAKRRESLARLDTLLQSTFLDLFGDPVTNPMGWEFKPLAYGVESFEGGKNLTPTDIDRPDSVRVLKVSAVTSGEYRPDQSKAFSSEEIVQSSHMVKKGDLLISRANTAALVGAVCHVWDTVGLEMLPDKLWRFIWNDSRRIEPLYMLHLARSDYFREQLIQRATGTSGSMKNIGKKKMLEIPIPYPPLNLQHHFATIVESVEQQKTSQRAHLAELDTLFAALQQRAFNGEL